MDAENRKKVKAALMKLVLDGTLDIGVASNMLRVCDDVPVIDYDKK